MPITAVRTGNTFRVTVPIAGAAHFRLDMSLQRHAWAWIGSADAKPMNSVLHGSVSEAQIQQDLLNLGAMIQARANGDAVNGLTEHRPPLHDQVLAIRRLGNLPKAGEGLVAHVTKGIKTAIATNMFGTIRCEADEPTGSTTRRSTS